MKTKALCALALACAVSSRATPILHVEETQDWDSVNVRLLPENVEGATAVHLFVDGIFVGDDGVFIHGHITDGSELSVGEHFASMGVTIDGVTQTYPGDVSYTVFASEPNPFPENMNTGWMSVALIGLFAFKKHFRA